MHIPLLDLKVMYATIRDAIASDMVYPKPLRLQGCLRKIGYKPGDLHVAERPCGKVLPLPVYPELSPRQIEHLAATLLKYYSKS